jgi:hypothetical protein
LYENSDVFKSTICFSFSYAAKVIKVKSIKDESERYNNNVLGIKIEPREENIHSRIEKALKHLATFCPKKKEAF